MKCRYCGKEATFVLVRVSMSVMESEAVCDRHCEILAKQGDGALSIESGWTKFTLQEFEVWQVQES
jgi:hypothetical protein